VKHNWNLQDFFSTLHFVCPEIQVVGNLKRKACPEVYGRTSGLHYQNSSKIQRVAEYQMSDVFFEL